jgi:hypothetical protein
MVGWKGSTHPALLTHHVYPALLHRLETQFLGFPALFALSRKPFVLFDLFLSQTSVLASLASPHEIEAVVNLIAMVASELIVISTNKDEFFSVLTTYGATSHTSIHTLRGM